MKGLVVYDTKFGNTQKIAEAVAEAFEGKAVNVSDYNPQMLEGVNILVVGSPIHGWRPSEATIHFLAQYFTDGTLVGKYVAAFDTGYHSKLSGNAASKIVKALKRAGGTQIAPTHKFIVEKSEGPLASNEVAVAQDWADEIKTRFEEIVYPVGAVI